MTKHPFLPALPCRLILASQSPRRRELLATQGLNFAVQPAHLVETRLDGETPSEHAQRLATEKAAKVALAESDALVLGSDTIVVIDSKVLGKPVDFDDACEMLGRLSGRSHEVTTAVALHCEERGFRRVRSECTRVHFRKLTPEEIAAYVRGGEPMDKAGSYGIQAWGALLVDSIEGCYFNVMGLPLQSLRRLLWEFVEDGDTEEGTQ
jgi:nucleoside triphosphate pyrophosphatase